MLVGSLLSSKSRVKSPFLVLVCDDKHFEIQFHNVPPTQHVEVISISDARGEFIVCGEGATTMPSANLPNAVGDYFLGGLQEEAVERYVPPRKSSECQLALPVGEPLSMKAGERIAVYSVRSETASGVGNETIWVSLCDHK